jgi:hypothetical protein
MAKSAAVAAPTPSVIASATQSGADTTEAPVSAQTGNSPATGAASTSIASISILLAALFASVLAIMC